MLTPQQKYDRSEKGLERHRRHYLKNKKKYVVNLLARYHNKDVQVCSIKGCSEQGERHHKDYDKPKDVIWLCRKHHMAVHGRVRQKCSLCDKMSHARKLCNTHYMAWLRGRKVSK